MTITGPDETRQLFQYQADKNDDRPIQLPLIALRRDRPVDILRLSKAPMTFDGLLLEASSIKSKSLNAVPIRLSYQIDVFTRYREEADEYLRNFVYNLINYPQFQVTIPYNGLDMPHESNITLVSPVEDNSSIPERLVVGQFTRYTIKFTVEDAYLFSVGINDNLTISSVETVVE